MLLSYNNLPFAIIIVILCFYIFLYKKISKNNLCTIDGKISIIGFIFGIAITLLNFRTINAYLITIGPLISITCILYLLYQARFSNSSDHYKITVNERDLKIVSIIYWLCIFFLLIIYQQYSFHRPPIFFIIVSIAISMIGIEIISSKKTHIRVSAIIFKILLLSLILRNSAFYISPYPVGSDPWAHTDLIEHIINYGSLDISTSIINNYINYPLMHLYACIVSFIVNFNIKNSINIVGTALVLSTLFVYLMGKEITENVEISLLSLLLVNFIDFHVKSSVQVIAMTLGLALYTIILYLNIKKTNKKYALFYKGLSVFFAFVLVWTHTISIFITVVSFITLYVGSQIYKLVYSQKGNNSFISITLCILSIVIMLAHWMNPEYPFRC